eukprot:663044_1
MFKLLVSILFVSILFELFVSILFELLRFLFPYDASFHFDAFLFIVCAPLPGAMLDASLRCGHCPLCTSSVHFIVHCVHRHVAFVGWLFGDHFRHPLLMIR